jgi:hypothetical protein
MSLDASCPRVLAALPRFHAVLVRGVSADAYENPAMAGSMDPAAIAVTLRYAPVKGPEGGGLGGRRDGTATFREDGQGGSGECSSIRNELSVPDSVGRRKGSRVVE